ncbi:MAG TPA: SusD/RagB family nutrient-binding outer membrane lipoprotein, partial [Bacteroidetes bacterium]|nr:SusD/RagB family nutrient-binding outer membrane lipoprotein [Bacteroidota bacterium]
GIFQSADQPAIIFTVAEDRLNRAELAVKALTSENAKTLYEAGVTASFMTLGLGAGDAIVYLSKAFNNVNWESSANKVEAIITQKWIATNGLTAEQAWFDYNRTGYPAGVPVPLNQSYTERPVRLAYPASEYTSNGDNVPTQPDVFSVKIFWAQ